MKGHQGNDGEKTGNHNMEVVKKRKGGSKETHKDTMYKHRTNKEKQGILKEAARKKQGKCKDETRKTQGHHTKQTREHQAASGDLGLERKQVETFRGSPLREKI